MRIIHTSPDDSGYGAVKRYRGWTGTQWIPVAIETAGLLKPEYSTVPTPGKTNINLENDGIEDKMIFLLTMAIGRCYVRFQRVLSLLQDMLSAFIAEMCANMHKLNIMKPSPDRVL